MKKTIWVFENVDGEQSFYTSIKILMLLSSVINWKKHNHTHTELHVDSMTVMVLNNLGVLDLWDEIHTNIIQQDVLIDKKTFWASSKLRVLINQAEPVTLIDYDFIAYTNLTEIGLDSVFVYSHDENGNNAYPTVSDPIVKQLTSIPDFLKWSETRHAANVSYLAFNDIEFQNQYAKYSLSCMEEMSALNAFGDMYLCFAEQKILKQFALYKKIKHTPLIKNEFASTRQEWNDKINPDGVWFIEEVPFKFRHFGPDKRLLNNESSDFRFLCNSIRSKIDQPILDRILELDQPSL